MYLTAAPHGWPGILCLSAMLAIATLGSMLALTWLTLLGVQRLRWRWLQRFDSRLIGALLAFLGVATVAFHH